MNLLLQRQIQSFIQMNNQGESHLESQMNQLRSLDSKHFTQNLENDQIGESNINRMYQNFDITQKQLIQDDNKSINESFYEKEANESKQMKGAQKDNQEYQSKDKKVDIKKLIQIKQSREAKQKLDLLISTNKQYFQKTHNSIIERCVFCGQTTFGIPKDSKQTFKINHVKSIHSDFYSKNLKLLQSKQGDQKDENETYNSIAQELYSFLNDETNKQMMEYILGRHLPQQFSPYVQRLQVDKRLGKWSKAVERRFSLLG